MFFKTAILLTVLLAAGTGGLSEEKITILDATQNGMALQEYCSRVFSGEKSTVPQELEINIEQFSGGKIDKLPANTVIADDGLGKEIAASGLKRTVFAVQPVVIAVSKNNPLNELDLPTLKRVFSGRVGNWSRIGGKNRRIITGGAAGESPVGRVFRRMVMEQSLTEKDNGDITKSIAPDMILCRSAASAEALLQAADNVIVFAGAAMSDKQSEKYKLLKVDGVYPSRENILSGKYKLAARHSVLSDSVNQPPALKKLLDFLKRSADASADILAVKSSL